MAAVLWCNGAIFSIQSFVSFIKSLELASPRMNTTDESQDRDTIDERRANTEKDEANEEKFSTQICQLNQSIQDIKCCLDVYHPSLSLPKPKVFPDNSAHGIPCERQEALLLPQDTLFSNTIHYSNRSLDQEDLQHLRNEGQLIVWGLSSASCLGKTL